MSSASPEETSPHHSGAPSKGRRGPVSSSCAECKRLKIRCSGTSEPFPCASCVKRGVAAICPDGVMNGRVKRDMGDSEILRRRNQALTARIKELELELAKARSGAAGTPSASSSDRKTDDDDTVYSKEDASLVENFGTLTIEDSGRTTWHNSYTPSINLLPANLAGESLLPDESTDATLPPELALLVTSFPFSKGPQTPGMKDTIRAMCPSYEGAVALADAFFTRAAWMGSPCTRERFENSILIPLYQSKSWELERADVIGLFLGILSVAVMFDQTRPQYDPQAFLFHKLSSASLVLADILERPTLSGLEALQCSLFFHQLTDTPSAISRLWPISAIAFRMAQALGIHRDSREWGLDPQVEERRRWLFWHLNWMDTVMSAAYGRPKFFNPRHYDCPFPDESSRPDLKGGEYIALTDGWALIFDSVAHFRFRFLQNGFIPVLEEAFSVRPAPTYATIMRLDTRLRDLPNIDPTNLGIDIMQMTSGDLMQVFCIGGMKELVFLYLHRRFLFEAISDDECTDLKTHKYAYSLNAGLKAALAITRQMRGLYWKDPVLATRLFFLWLHGFSAYAIFAAIAIKRPGCEYAETSMSELQSLLNVFQQAQTSKRARSCLPTMIALRDKAVAVMSLHRAGHAMKVPLDKELDNLIGGTPVVLRVKSPKNPACTMPNPEPVDQRKLAEFDLQALFGVGTDNLDPNYLNLNAMFQQPQEQLQTGPPAFEPMQLSEEWGTEIPNFSNNTGSSDVDKVLFGYFNDQMGLIHFEPNRWGEMSIPDMA